MPSRGMTRSSYFITDDAALVSDSPTGKGPVASSAESVSSIRSSMSTPQPGRRRIRQSRGLTRRPGTSRSATGQSTTSRPYSAFSSRGAETQQIICALSESRGVAPTVGLAFLNLSTSEAVLSQVSDTHAYTRTIHKIGIFAPSCILMLPRTASSQSGLLAAVQEGYEDSDDNIIFVDRGYWSDQDGLEYIQRLAFPDQFEAISTAINGAYYAISSFAAVCKYLQVRLGQVFESHCLRISYQPSEGAMMIDLSTIRSLELLQNLNDARSKECLFGHLNKTQTPMGCRLLKITILQPLTDIETLNSRYDALDELSTKESMFVGVRSALKGCPDVDRLLTQFTLMADQVQLRNTEQALNNIILLKQFVGKLPQIHESLVGCQTKMLEDICMLCDSQNLVDLNAIVDATINEDTVFARQSLDLQNQRTYAIKAGANGFLDVARQTYKEAMTDALDHIDELCASEEFDVPMLQKYDSTRLFFLRMRKEDLEGVTLPPTFVNVCHSKTFVECQTLELMKRNQKIVAAHNEVLTMSDDATNQLIVQIRQHIPLLFKIAEAVSMLDMLLAFAQLVTVHSYVRPSLEETLAVTGGRHPLCEVIRKTEFRPNDIFATRQTRFQIITGCNMSGKSTYIRTVALLTVMAQVGCFIPANYAVMPVIRQLFARISLDDDLESNISTFAAEMREMAFILQNIDSHSMAIVDELGRGTSTRDGLAIALAISEAMIQSQAFVWFATHFRDLAQILSERAGVVSMHLVVDMGVENAIRMLYRIEQGVEQEPHHGLRLARSLTSLPSSLIDRAEVVSAVLDKRLQAQQRIGQSLAVIRARRRRLLLNLKERLQQARDSQLTETDLAQWLKELRQKFVLQMQALEEQEMQIDHTSAATCQSRSNSIDSMCSQRGEREAYTRDDNVEKDIRL